MPLFKKTINSNSSVLLGTVVTDNDISLLNKKSNKAGTEYWQYSEHTKYFAKTEGAAADQNAEMASPH